MSQRVTFTQMATHVQQHIFDNYGRLDKSQQQLSSGKRIMRPSDDPVSVATDLQLRANLGQFKQYTRNIDDGLSYLASVDSVLQSGNNLFQHLREKAIQGGSDTLNAANRQDIWQEVRVVFDQMVSLANTTFKGQYIFSGTQTQTPPYQVVDGRDAITTQLDATTVGTPIQLTDLNITDANTATGIPNASDIIPGSVSVTGYTEGVDYSMDYHNGTITFTPPATNPLNDAAGAGIEIQYSWLRRSELDMDGIVNREVAENTVARLNTTVSDAYGAPNETTSWDAMITLLEGLHLNDGATIRGSISELDESLDRHLGTQATNGARTNQYEASKERIANANLSLSDLQSQIEDVDFAEAVSQMQLQQAVYQASLQVSARSIQQSLMNFL
jgi:flagellar hook-associated protein 3 FlgL